MGLRSLLLASVFTTGALLSTEALSAALFYSMTVEASSQATGQAGVTSSCSPTSSTGCGAHLEDTLPLVQTETRSLHAEASAAATSTSAHATVTAFAPADLRFTALPTNSLLSFFSSGGGIEQSVIFAGARARANGNMTLTLSEHFVLEVPPALQGTSLSLVLRTPIEGTIDSHPTNAAIRFGLVASSSLNDGDVLIRDFIGTSINVDDVLSTMVDIQRSNSVTPTVTVDFSFSALVFGSAAAGLSNFGYQEDFGSTVGLELLVPEGVTLTSASGLFERFVVDESVPAVPEPTSFPLMAIGLAALAFCARRRQM
jgi:hypothetical protein